MNRRQILILLSTFFLSWMLSISCSPTPKSSDLNDIAPIAQKEPIVIGYSNWPGWWPWAIAEKEGFFAKNNVNVEMKWFDDYLESMEAFAAGQLDGNCQTLNDTISFTANSVYGEVAILVNDNSAGNDKIIAAKNISKVADLKGKKVALEEGVVVDFLLSLALESNAMKRDDVEIVSLETAAAAAAFASGQTDAVGAFSPFWLTALKREGSKELISSAEFPGAIPDLLVVSQKLIDDQPHVAQGLVRVWFDTLDFIEQNPDQADQIMATRANVSIEELKLFKQGTKIFTVAENLAAFREGDDMKHLSFAASRMAEFMLSVGFISETPDLGPILDDQFIKAYAEAASNI